MELKRALLVFRKNTIMMVASAVISVLLSILLPAAYTAARCVEVDINFSYFTSTKAIELDLCNRGFFTLEPLKTCLK